MQCINSDSLVRAAEGKVKPTPEPFSVPWEKPSDFYNFRLCRLFFHSVLTLQVCMRPPKVDRPMNK